MATPSSTQTAVGGIQLAAAAPLLLFNSAPRGQPEITGALISGQQLGVDVSDIADADGLGDFSYQWHRGDSASFVEGAQTRVADATGSNYGLLDVDVDSYLRVVVSFTDGRGKEESVVSDATEEIGAAMFVSETMSAVGAVADLSTATVFTEALTTHLGSPSTGLQIDGQAPGSRLRSILQSVLPASGLSGQCARGALAQDPHNRLQYGISGTDPLSSPCASLDEKEMMRRLRSAAEVGDISLGLGGGESGLDLWFHATSFQVSGSPLVNGSALNYDGSGLLAYMGVALKGSEKFKYGFTFGLSDTSVDLALVSGGSRNDSVARNLLFGSGFIDYRLGSSADYRFRAVLGLGFGDANFTVVNDANGQAMTGSAGAGLTFFTLNFSREFKIGDNWKLTPAIQLVNSSGSTDAVTLTSSGSGDPVQMGSGSSKATEFSLGLDTSVNLSGGGQFTIGTALRNGSGDLEYSGAGDLIVRYQSNRLSAQLQQQITGGDNERNIYSFEYVVLQPQVREEYRSRFSLTVGADYNRTIYYEAGGERDGPLALGYFGRFGYAFGKENAPGAGALGVRMRLDQEGEVSTDFSLDIGF